MIGAPGETAREHIANAITILDHARPMTEQDRTNVALRFRAALLLLPERCAARRAVYAADYAAHRGVYATAVDHARYALDCLDNGGGAP